MLDLSCLGVLMISYAAIVATNRFLFQMTPSSPDRTDGSIQDFEILVVLGNGILLFGFFADQGYGGQAGF